jgi:hypothetical protein
MTPQIFDAATHFFGAPKGWDEEKDGKCSVLPVLVVEHVHASVWKFSDEERARIAAGENLVLYCYGAQTPVALEINHIEGELKDASSL